MLRLFFALQPSAELGARLLDSAAPVLADLHAQAVPASNLHATLSFLGAVAPERLEDLRRTAAAVRGAPVDLEFDELDYWDKPRVLVAGSSRESPEAFALASALQLEAVAAGFAPDQKPFRAHLTLARKIRPALAQEFAWPRKISPGFVVRFENFVLMESRRGEQGSIYSVIDSWPLYALGSSRVTQ